ncbi:hypothetical protein [Cellulomonas oligotrophica]|uniref:Uncharacterized protein n=1 Tax=Cellulomonas oligotrophica TaxID=931536 RepID=A0A7Y9FIE3_9CELL|nr:hypothetical protein [Cellulomonas oligotrophica]NYD87779.1 hypothetical protein [Cellulomonas oligotrophica]GIG33017.1 hypothetical protein Col01nite_21760 [Cellulomonas oligotrophica]
MPTPEQIAALIEYVGAHDSEADEALAGRKYDEAAALVDRYIGAGYAHLVPATVRDEQVLEVASKLWQRRLAPNGDATYNTLDGAPTPAPRDPMAAAYPVLDRFLPGGFA